MFTAVVTPVCDFGHYRTVARLSVVIAHAQRQQAFYESKKRAWPGPNPPSVASKEFSTELVS
jgi:hypothetical protein